MKIEDLEVGDTFRLVLKEPDEEMGMDRLNWYFERVAKGVYLASAVNYTRFRSHFPKGTKVEKVNL